MKLPNKGSTLDKQQRPEGLKRSRKAVASRSLEKRDPGPPRAKSSRTKPPLNRPPSVTRCDPDEDPPAETSLAPPGPLPRTRIYRKWYGATLIYEDLPLRRETRGDAGRRRAHQLPTGSSASFLHPSGRERSGCGGWRPGAKPGRAA